MAKAKVSSWIWFAGLAWTVALSVGLYLLAMRYGPPLVHTLRTGELDLAVRADQPRPRFTAGEGRPDCVFGRCRAVISQGCDPDGCHIDFDQGHVTPVGLPGGDPSAAPPFTGHFPQRLGYRVVNGGEDYQLTVAVAYRPLRGQDRLGDDVDTTEAWEHLAGGINLAPVAGRTQWLSNGRDARLQVTAYDGGKVTIDIRQPVAAEEVLCYRGVVLFGPRARREVLVATLAKCLENTSV